MSQTSVNRKQPSWRGSKTISNRADGEVAPGDESARLTVDDVQDEEILSNSEYDIPPPPDGGYGWVIVIASFFCNMIVDGIAYTFGVFLSQYGDYFNEGKGKIAWVGSLLSGVYLLCGPIVSALSNKFGCRAVCIAGSIIGCVAFVLSTLCTSVTQMMLIYGVLGGIGFGLIYLPAVVCVGYYFETKRSLATGIAVCGSGFGTFVLSPVAEYLLHETTLGWKGAHLVLSGLILLCAAFGFLMKPLEAGENTHRPLLQRMAEEKRFQMERGSIGGSYFIVQKPDGSMEKRMKMPINVDPGVHSSFNLDQLVPGTPVNPAPAMTALPTITEVKASDINGGSGNNSNTGSVDFKADSKSNVKFDTDMKDDDDDDDKVDDEMDVEEEEEVEEEEDNSMDAEDKKVEKVKGLPRNASQPAFTTHVQGLHKNGSVPNFDRIRKTSASERYRPNLGHIKAAKPPAAVNSNGDNRKSLHLHLSTTSKIAGSRNNTDDMWSKTDVDQDTVSFSASKHSIKQVKKEYIRPMSRKDIFYSGSIINLPEYQSQKSLATYRMSVTSIPRCSRSMVNVDGDQDAVSEDIEKPCDCYFCPESIGSVLGSMVDVTLLKDPVFMLIGVSNIFGMAALYVPFVYLVEAAEFKEVDRSSASTLLSIMGITNTIGRVLFGFIADFPSVNSMFLNNLCLLVCTLSLAAIPFCSVYIHFAICAMFFGVAVSGYISLTSIILVDLLGLGKLTNAFGLLLLFRGFAAIIGSPLAGDVLDRTKTYDIPFYMAAGFFLISTVTSVIAPYLKCCVVPEEEPPMLDVLTPIDEDEENEEEEEEENDHQTVIQVPEIVETASTPNHEMKSPTEVIKQIESVV